MSRNRTFQPESIHTQFASGEYGATSLIEEARRTDDVLRYRGRGRKPVLEGTWGDGQAGVEIARVLAEQGMIDDQTRLGELPEVQGRGALPTFTLLAGTGATSNSDGTDLAGIIGITPSNSGVTGTFFQVTFSIAFGTALYAVVLFPRTSAAQAITGNLNTTSHTADGFSIRTAVALTNGSDYRWSYIVVPF